MPRNPEFQFIPTDKESIVSTLVAGYERIVETTVRPAGKERLFLECQNVLETEHGRYRVYDIERSVCDAIRFRAELEEDVFAYVIECYKRKNPSTENLLQCAKKLRLLNQVKQYV